jgi:adenylate kinase family enzyme
MKNYNRISIVGNSSLGKSTLARKMGGKLDIEIFTVDKIYWLPGWKQREQSSFKALHDNWLFRDRWIIDGVGYWEELENRLNHSDLIIYLIIPVSVCKQRAENRINEEKIKPNQDIIEGCCYRNVRDLQMRTIENFEVELKPSIMKLIESLKSVKVRIISNKDELHL